jgi:Sec-independent protein translocase protein TatA
MMSASCFAVLPGLFGLAGGEILLILALGLVLFGAKHLPGIGTGLRSGFKEFRKQTGTLLEDIDAEATEAGRSAGGIFGKPAAEALTPDNRVAELYDPAALRGAGQGKHRGRDWWRRSWRWIQAFLRQVLGKQRE